MDALTSMPIIQKVKRQFLNTKERGNIIMHQVIIVNEDFYWDEDISTPCYRLVAEEDGVRSFSFLTKYLGIEFWKNKVFCGLTCFYEVPETETTTHFSCKYKRYFSEHYNVGVLNVDKQTKADIEQFNIANTLNALLKKHNKPLKHKPTFEMKQLIESCELVFVEELYSGHNGHSLLFFESNKIDSKQYMIDFFKTFNIDVLDNT